MSNNTGTSGVSSAIRLSTFISRFNQLAQGNCVLEIASTIQGPSGPSADSCHKQGTGASGTCADFHILPNYTTACRDFFYQAARESNATVLFLDEYDSACIVSTTTGGNIHVEF